MMTHLMGLYADCIGTSHHVKNKESHWDYWKHSVGALNDDPYYGIVWG